jgi:hypothetical protein
LWREIKLDGHIQRDSSHFFVCIEFLKVKHAPLRSSLA